MKVYIGPYKNWFGPYQATNWLRTFLNEAWVDWITEKLPEAPFTWFNDLFQRKIKIRIDDYDVWGMDHTLSYIIYPMLLKIKQDKHGTPYVDDIDVPEEIRSTAAGVVMPTEEGGMDSNFEKRWEWVLDQMIYSFSALVDEENSIEDSFFKTDEDGKSHFDREGHQKESEKVQNGFILFGKYFRSLWT